MPFRDCRQVTLIKGYSSNAVLISDFDEVYKTKLWCIVRDCKEGLVKCVFIGGEINKRATGFRDKLVNIAQAEAIRITPADAKFTLQIIEPRNLLITPPAKHCVLLLFA